MNGTMRRTKAILMRSMLLLIALGASTKDEMMISKEVNGDGHL
jgi:hypothetical protein